MFGAINITLNVSAIAIGTGIGFLAGVLVAFSIVKWSKS